MTGLAGLGLGDGRGIEPSNRSVKLLVNNNRGRRRASVKCRRIEIDSRGHQRGGVGTMYSKVGVVRKSECLGEEIPLGDQKDLGNMKAMTQGTSSKRPAHSKLEDRNKDLLATTLSDFDLAELTNNYKGVSLPRDWKAFSTVIFHEQSPKKVLEQNSRNLPNSQATVIQCDDNLNNLVLLLMEAVSAHHQTNDLKPSEKIAGFDFDGCLVNTSVRRHGADAWSLCYSSVPDTLRYYHSKGYKLVVFTNESNIDRWTNKRKDAIDSKLGRLRGLMGVVEVPLQIFVSCGKANSGDAYRKPAAGMWLLMEQHFNAGIVIDKERSFYVGDAAGRPADHSAADRDFAEAAGVKFLLPEEVFMNPNKTP